MQTISMLTCIQGRLEPQGLLILVYTWMSGKVDEDGVIHNPILLGIWDKSGRNLECIEYTIGQIGTYTSKGVEQ